MQIRRSILVLTLFLVSAQAASAPSQTPNRLPNFIIILADDLGYGDLGSYGAGGYETPHLDQMARDGIRFTNFHVAESVCTASRVGLLTGCYPKRVSLTGALSPSATKGIHADEILLPEILKRAGYATACFGKWHLGHHPPFLPTRHGFDEYFGLPYSNDMWPNHPKPEAARKFPPLPLMEGERIVKYLNEQSQLTTLYTEKSLDFIQRNHTRPFFLYLPHSMPHVPLYVSGKFEGKAPRGLFGDVIEEIDWSVGQILSQLEELGLENNTLVIFTSDNGPWLSYGNHAGSAGNFREGKHTIFEGGFRVPCIMRWPGRIKRDSVCSQFASTLDLLPTIAQLVDQETPSDRIIDGHNIWPIIEGRPEARSPWETFYFYKNGLLAVRWDKWKLVLPHNSHHVVTPGSDGMPGETKNIPVGLALYDTLEDEAEARDVSKQHPEVVEHMLKIADGARDDLGDELTGREGKGVRPAGKL